MTDTLLPAGEIFEGLWTDWTHGRTWGLTLTLCPTSSVILTNTMAMFVTLTGLQLWTIVRYMLHQRPAALRFNASTPHVQQQLILRNASSALATAKMMLELAWSSRHHTENRSLRALGIGLFAIVYAVLFMGAGAFSNRAIASFLHDGVSAVILRNPRCGVFNGTYLDLVFDFDKTVETNFEPFASYDAKSAEEIQFSMEYAQQCYIPESNFSDMTIPSACHSLRTPQLRWTSSAASCPFQTEMCQREAIPLTLDTGDINSHFDLGINAPAQDRLTYRRVTTCTVLDDRRFLQGWNGSITSKQSTASEQDEARMYLGPSLNKGTSWTYSYSNFAQFYDNFTNGVTTPYQLGFEHTMGVTDPQWTASDFEAIPALQPDDSDLTLFFLGFTGRYHGPIDDPWFSAHVEQEYQSSIPALRKLYARDAAISTIACTEKHGFCTHNGTCTGLMGFDQVQNVASFNAALSPHQNATFDRILQATATSYIYEVVQRLAKTTNPLLASNATIGMRDGSTLSKLLPDHQWQLEVKYWHSIAMAQLQRNVLQWGTGQVAPETPGFTPLLKPTAEQDRWFCDNIVIPSSTYQSFHFVAILLLVIFGTLIIVASFFIDQLARMIRRISKRSKPRMHWEHDDLLALQLTRSKSYYMHTPAIQSEKRQPTLQPYYRPSTGFLNAAIPMTDCPRKSSQTLSDSEAALVLGGYKTMRSHRFEKPLPSLPTTPRKISHNSDTELAILGHAESCDQPVTPNATLLDPEEIPAPVPERPSLVLLARSPEQKGFRSKLWI